RDPERLSERGRARHLMTDQSKPRLRPGERWPSLQAEAKVIAGDFDSSWFGKTPSTRTRTAADQSELARLKREDARLNDQELELAARMRAKREKIQARIDKLETERYQQAWDDDTVDDLTDESDADDFVFDDDDEQRSAVTASGSGRSTVASLPRCCRTPYRL